MSHFGLTSAVLGAGLALLEEGLDVLADEPGASPEIAVFKTLRPLLVIYSQ
jgi:hypothetical protein